MTISQQITTLYEAPAYSLNHSPDGPVVAASPGDGWLIKVTQKADGKTWTEPVVAWLVHQNGVVIPAVIDEPQSGGTWFPTRDDKFEVRIFHPSAPADSFCSPLEHGDDTDAGQE